MDFWLWAGLLQDGNHEYLHRYLQKRGEGGTELLATGDAGLVGMNRTT